MIARLWKIVETPQLEANVRRQDADLNGERKDKHAPSYVRNSVHTSATNTEHCQCQWHDGTGHNMALRTMNAPNVLWMSGNSNEIFRNLASCGCLVTFSKRRANNSVTSAYKCSDKWLAKSRKHISTDSESWRCNEDDGSGASIATEAAAAIGRWVWHTLHCKCNGVLS
jgi:hypothetical protein